MPTNDTTPDYIAQALYPATSASAAKHFYLGKSLQDVQAPVPILDVAVIRRNCELMLQATQTLSVSFRAHVKTHKTIELAQLQVGKRSQDIRIIVSTVAEAENLTPWLLESKANGKAVSVLYGLPVAPSAISRLARLSQRLGKDSMALIIDHADQVSLLEQSPGWHSDSVPVMLKIDVGYHRAGVEIGKKQMTDVAERLRQTEQVKLVGFYAHMGHSYSVSSSEEANQHFATELKTLEQGASLFLQQTELSSDLPYVLSLGATPTATSIQNLADNSALARESKALIESIKQTYEVEVHAGVYPVLDMQQLATRARPQHDQSQSLLSYADLGLRMLVEVASIYDDRDKPEALIAAGSIVLGREPCKSYPGWGVIAPWPAMDDQIYDPEGSRTGWIVDRISQEHGVLQWHGSLENFRPLAIGEKLLVWPNHACMSGPNFGFYLVVDSDTADSDQVIDVWTRSRGW